MRVLIAASILLGVSSLAAAAPGELECGARRLALEHATGRLPERPLLPQQLFDALQLQDCGDARPNASSSTPLSST